MNRTLFFLCAALITSLPSLAAAQSKTGTAVGQFLLIEPSARLSGMGNAGVGVSDDLQAVFYNPGAIGTLGHGGLAVTHSEWLAGINFDYVAGALPVRGWGNLFASVTALNSGEIDVRTVEQPLGTGERYTASDLALGLGYGRSVTDRFSAGLQLNYAQETIWHTSLRTVLLNVGTVYRLNQEGMKLGASISNYGTRSRFRGRDLAIQYDNVPGENGDNSALPGERKTDDFPMPVLFRVGVTWPRQLASDSRLLLAADAFHPSDNTESLSFGAEWLWRDSLALRSGFQHLAQEDAEGGLTLGAGLAGSIGERRFHFDYAWTDHGRLDAAHRLTFEVSL